MTRIRSALVSVTALVIAVTLSSCGDAATSVATTSAAQPPFSPAGDFADVFNAGLAGGPEELSLAVAGRTPGPKKANLTVRVYRKARDRRWSPMPRLARGLDPSGSPHVVQYRGDSCVGYETSGAQRTLSCSNGRAWRSLPSAGTPSVRARLIALTVVGGRLTASYLSGQDARARVVVSQLRGKRWRQVGSSLPTGGAISVVGESADSGSVDVVLSDLRRETRTIWTLANGRWSRHPVLRGPGVGPQPGGPVRLGDDIFLAVTDASVTPWTFSVYALSDGRWSRVGGRLSGGPGNAQGVIDAVDGSVWATWQESAPLDTGGFATRMYTQTVSPIHGEPRELWRGTSAGPGDLMATSAIGEQWVLYMPRPANSRYLTARVESLP